MQSTVGQDIGVRELLEAGVHFGHQAKRWNPKMKKYIFAQRAGVHIIDLDQTLTLLDRSRKFIRGVAEAGREVLFVGTKKQAQFTVAEQAVRSGQPYVVERYIGGMLTNFQTIQPRIQHFKTLVQTVEETPEEERTGREWFALYREFQKLRRNFAGLTEMERLPGAVFVIDPKREELLVKEANRLKIPVVALTDTNCDPDVVDYVIPGNDDAIRAINLISQLIADAIFEGLGEEPTPAVDRPMPPAVEEAMVAEELATEPLSEAATEGGVSENNTHGLADPVESAGEIAPEEDPTTSYRGAENRQERARDRAVDAPAADATTADEPGVPEAGRASSGDAEGVPGGGQLRPGEETALREGTDEDAPVGEAPEGSDATPADADGDEERDNERVGEN
ncbi:MAG: SSU ribosomal protein S2p (SAe) [uncultured Rubrobacteraceae bacterium]|uniref:Small ribosomal subunit protein uS2 n=1 Tax=uncultured Rubrobacteraceae bacterium TaxID=349277 RepID=A0A6J4R3N7_9ACTN|nr:MAG: SSU ribosomal protein S2p (SAe) [uncultured Rubrobacteraceae bacterium]